MKVHTTPTHPIICIVSCKKSYQLQMYLKMPVPMKLPATCNSLFEECTCSWVEWTFRSAEIVLFMVLLVLLLAEGN